MYPNPEKFDPDRWSPGQCATRSPYAWLPFSYGQRAGIGAQLSLIEQRMALAEVVRRFHIRLDPSTCLKVTEPLFLNPAGVHLRVVARTQGAPPPVTVMASQPVSDFDVGDLESLHGKQLVVLFGTNMGSCEDFADKMYRRGTAMGMTCTKAPLDAVCGEEGRTPEGRRRRGAGHHQHLQWQAPRQRKAV